MKIKLSKSQWESIRCARRKTAFRGAKYSEPKTISARELYQEFIAEGKAPEQAATEVIDILSNGYFVAIEEPKRSEMINNMIKKCK